MLEQRRSSISAGCWLRRMWSAWEAGSVHLKSESATFSTADLPQRVKHTIAIKKMSASTRDVKSPQNFHLTSGKRWGDPGWFEITSPHLTKIEVILKSPHLTSKKSRWFQNHLTSPQKILRWNGYHLTSPQKFWGDFKITSPHLEKSEVTLKSPHLTSPQNWKINKFVIVFWL